MRNIQISQPIIEEDEKQAVQAVLDSGMVAQGPKVEELEAAFAKYCGTKYAVAVNNGTAAIHAALHAADVGPGDSVLTTPFTFIATVNTVLMQGAKVKFVDIEPDTFNINTKKLDDAYEPGIKAIIPVDLYGQPADYDGIWKFASRHNIRVIEDACQSIGASYKKKTAGSLGDLACFSLYATKNIMSGEGGVITTQDEDLAKDLKSFRQHGMDMNGKYEYVQLGYNYRTTDILAAIALSQLKKADRFNRARAANAKKLTIGLRGMKGLTLPTVRPDRTSVFHQYTVRITNSFPVSREKFISKLKQRGITAAIYYPKPLHHYPHIAKMGYKEGDFPIAEQAAQEVVSLPVHPSLSEDDIDYIIKTIKEIARE